MNEWLKLISSLFILALFEKGHHKLIWQEVKFDPDDEIGVFSFNIVQWAGNQGPRIAHLQIMIYGYF